MQLVVTTDFILSKQVLTDEMQLTEHFILSHKTVNLF